MINISGIGRLGQNPEISYKESGLVLTKFSIASRSYKGETTWFNCVAFNKTAEIIADYVKKRDQLFIIGSLEINEWTDNDGTKRSKPQIVVSQVELIGNKDKDSNQQTEEVETEEVETKTTSETTSEQIPF